MSLPNLVRLLRAWLPVCALLLPALALAQEGDGDVQISLERYEALVQGSREPPTLPPEAPGQFALGQATASVAVSDAGGRPIGAVTVDLQVQVLEDGWVGVPLLPAGVAVTSSTVDGRPLQLVPGRGALLWGVRAAGTYAVHLEYAADARSFDGGHSLSIPLPQAPASLAATLPGAGLDVSAIPSSGLRATEAGGATRVTAAVPPSPGVQLSWQTPREQGTSISRASYSGELRGDAIAWTARFGVEVVGQGTATLPLLPSDVVLVELDVDGEPAPIEVQDGRFTTRVRGSGDHDVRVVFEVPVTRGDGPPEVSLRIPAVPVSRFELSLPGEMEIAVEPGSGVRSTTSRGRTVASVNVPMTEQVALSWSASIPEVTTAELRANAALYHAVHAEEGVLYVRATVAMEVTRGGTNRFELAVPAGAQINTIEADGGGVADWRVSRSAPDQPGVATVFLDREVRGEFLFTVSYERLLGSAADASTDIDVPLLSAQNVHRQRGMVALLASKELTLRPLSEDGLNRVGENQLPAGVRDAVDMTIAHTFKYVEAPPSLAVEATTPERQDGRFDARVDTLLSLGDVTMQGAATVQINVKSGSLMSLRVVLPPNVNFGALSAPSMRGYELTPVADGTAVDIDFTQELEGQFRVEISYEQLLGDAGDELVVPTLSVSGAEVEQGRIAVEALSAVEVQAATTEQLSSVDVSELPRQLVLRTTNPILLAYKYVQVDPPYKLGLKVTRHSEVDVQAATIDEAVYKTLFTKDGLAVTTATFSVRNRREQFLRVRLPAGSEIWSASVDGQAEKPALASGAPGGSTAPEVLIGIINSDQGFPVELVYATPVARLGLLGRVNHELPRPDMVVTRSQLDVLLPDSLRYGKASGDMDLVLAGAWAGGGEMPIHQAEDGAGPGPLRITVPETGIRYSFTKLYANQRDERVTVAISYSTPGGELLAHALALAGAAAFWALLLVSLLVQRRRPGGRVLAIVAIAAAITVFAVVWLGGSLAAPVTATAVALAIPTGGAAWRRVRAWRSAAGVDGSEEAEPESEPAEPSTETEPMEPPTTP